MLILPEYKIELLNKNKKVIQLFENIEKIEKDYIKQNYNLKNKKFNKKNKSRRYKFKSKSKRNFFENRKIAAY